MTCIHGLDEINCPTCRIISSTGPKNQLNIDIFRINNLKPIHPFLIQNYKEKEELFKKLSPKNIHNIPNIASISLKLGFNIQTPDFKNDMFFKRLDEIDVMKSDQFDILKKTSLKNPVLKLDQEEL